MHRIIKFNFEEGSTDSHPQRFVNQPLGRPLVLERRKRRLELRNLCLARPDLLLLLTQQPCLLGCCAVCLLHEHRHRSQFALEGGNP